MKIYEEMTRCELIKALKEFSSQENIKQSEGNYRLLNLISNKIPAYIAYVNADTLHYEFVNEAFEKSFGIPREKIIGSHIKKIIGEINYQFALKFINEVKLGKSISYENSFDFVSGKRWIQVNYTPDIDSNGHVASIIVLSYDITDRKRAEEALRRSQAMLVRTESITHVGSWELDVATGNVTWSDELFRIFQLNQAGGAPSIAKQHNLYHPEDMARLLDAVEIAVSNGTPYEIETRAIRTDGKTRFCLARGYAEMGPDGRAVRLFGSFQDITEHKQTEEELKAHIRFLESLELVDQAIKQEMNVEQMLWSIMKTVHSIFDCDRAWLLYPCDPDALSFRVPVEITRHEYPGARVLNVDVPMSPDMAQNMREALESDDLVTYIAGTERPINKVTAEQFGVQSQMFVPLYPKSGKPWVFGMHQCSYPRIWTKEEKKLFKEISRRISDGLSSVLFLRELQEKEERFRATFEQAAVGIAHVAPNGRLLWANQKLCDIVGYSREELLQKTFQDITYPDDLNIDLEYVRQVLSGEIPTYSMEKRYIRKDGSLVWINLTVSVVRNASGDPTYFIAVIEDIAKRKKAEEEKKKLQGQLLQSQKMESIGRLAGGVAHDFNNMLGVILGYVEMALYEVVPTDPITENLEAIRNAAERSANLTQQLLAFARKQIISPEVIDLNETVGGMLKMLRRLIGEDIDLAWKPASNLEPVKMDPTQIDQILVNLLVNARDSINGVGKVIIETNNAVFDEDYCATHTDSVPGEYVILAVSDNGCGMDRETLANIFEPFFTTKELCKGAGLGLATVYGIVKQNNGVINVYSEPGAGTTFKIYLPRYADKTARTSEKGPAEAVTGGMETVMLVEDELMILELGKAILKKLGYTVLTAVTPGEALRLAGEHAGELNLLMTDVVMPEMNGSDLAKRMLSLYPKLKCLFMSGYPAEVITHQGFLDEGMNFIQKPFSVKDIAIRVREALEQK